MHFHDVAERYPVAPNAAFLPPPARVDDYRQVQRRLGLERVVVVQRSAYGTDNRCTMDGAAALGDAARVVVVVGEPRASRAGRSTSAVARASRPPRTPAGWRPDARARAASGQTRSPLGDPVRIKLL
jgi:D-galactarolactone isomerase